MYSYQKMSKVKGDHLNLYFQMKINLRRIQMIHKKLSLKVQTLQISMYINFEDLTICLFKKYTNFFKAVQFLAN